MNCDRSPRRRALKRPATVVAPAHGGVSAFELHSVYIWNAELSNAQMKDVTSALRAQIGGSPDVSGGGTGDPVTAVVPAPTAYEQICQAGTYVSLTTGDCIGCLAGTYSATDGATECTSCLAGAYSASNEATECTSCLAGTYSASNEATECIACERGSFWDDQAVIPNTVLSLPHDASGIAGDPLHYSPKCAVNDGLLLHFTFDDDSMGLQNTAPFGQAVSLKAYGSTQIVQPGRVGVGYADVGVNNGYELLASGTPLTLFDNIYKYTISAWIHMDATVSGWTSLFRTPHFQLQFSSSNTFRIRFTGVTLGYSVYEVPLAEWFHFTLLVDEINCDYTLYIDGQWEEDIDFGNDCPTEHPMGMAYIGDARETGENAGIQGFIDDFRFYNRLLSVHEVNAMGTQSGNPPAGCYDRAACVAAVTADNGLDIPQECWLTSSIGMSIHFHFFCVGQVLVEFELYSYGTDGSSDSFRPKVDGGEYQSLYIGRKQEWTSRDLTWSLSTGAHVSRMDEQGS